MMHSIVRDYVRSQQLMYKQVSRTDCPACENHNTFIMTNMGDAVVYYCHHSSCGVTGTVSSELPSLEDMRSRDDIYERLADKAESQLKPFKIPDHFVSIKNNTDAVEFLARFPCRRAILDDRIDVRWDARKNLLVFLTWFSGVCYNAVGRNILHTPKVPKWQLYNKPNAGLWVPKTEFKQTDTVVVVEDAISAACVSEEADGYALLGTNMNDIHLHIISNYENTLVFLDPDADHKAHKIIEELQPYTKPKIVMSEYDPKDMTKLEIKRTIRNGKTDIKDVTEAVLLGEVWAAN